MAIDASAQKDAGTSHSSATTYNSFLRKYYWILEPMIGAVIMFVLWFFTFGFSNIILAFFYNKMYFNFLMEHGYRFTTVISGKAVFALENELEVRLEGKSDV